MIIGEPFKKYGIILCNPPWSYRVWSKKGVGRTAENHYSTMRLEDICALPVKELAAKDCALFLWAMLLTLQEAFSVIEAWGNPTKRYRQSGEFARGELDAFQTSRQASVACKAAIEVAIRDGYDGMYLKSDVKLDIRITF